MPARGLLHRGCVAAGSQLGWLTPIEFERNRIITVA